MPKIESDQVMVNHKIDDLATNYQTRSTTIPRDVKGDKDQIFKRPNLTRVRNFKTNFV
jgi:hypothetical protein